MALAPVGSTPITLMWGLSALTYEAIPATSPPPPGGCVGVWVGWVGGGTRA